MSTFAMAPRVPVPAPAAAFPTGIQFQDNGVNVGPPNPQNVSIDGVNTALTYNSATDTVHVAVGATTQSGVAAQPSFSARLAGADQVAGTTVIFNNTALAGGRGTTGYDTATGLFTVPVGQGGMWQFGAIVDLSIGLEVVNLKRHFDIEVNGAARAGSDERTVNANDLARLQSFAQFVVADGDVVRISMNVALSSGVGGIGAAAGADTRFWGARLSD